MRCRGFTKRTWLLLSPSVASDLCSLRLFCSCYGCAFELSTGIETEQYIQYMLRKVTMRRSCGVATVVLVFDGQRLPLKVQTNRHRQRELQRLINQLLCSL